MFRGAVLPVCNLFVEQINGDVSVMVDYYTGEVSGWQWRELTQELR